MLTRLNILLREKNSQETRRVRCDEQVLLLGRSVVGGVQVWFTWPASRRGAAAFV